MSTTPVYFAGIDIGSTASKTVVLKDGKIEDYFVLPDYMGGYSTIYSSDITCYKCRIEQICHYPKIGKGGGITTRFPFGRKI